MTDGIGDITNPPTDMDASYDPPAVEEEI